MRRLRLENLPLPKTLRSMRRLNYIKESPLETALRALPFGRVERTIDELTDICAVSRTTLNNWRSGRSCPTTPKKVKINNYFGRCVYPINF